MNHIEPDSKFFIDGHCIPLPSRMNTPIESYKIYIKFVFLEFFTAPGYNIAAIHHTISLQITSVSVCGH